jgi:DNA-binding NarL/FixJ family response regulator
MDTLCTLIVEDQKVWRDRIERSLRNLTPSMLFEHANTREQALDLARSRSFDLITMDIALEGDYIDPEEADEAGLEVALAIRQETKNASCALIILTGYSTQERTRLAYRELGVFDFIVKEDFDSRLFVDIARAAIRDSRLKAALDDVNHRYSLRMTLNTKHHIFSELRGPGTRGADDKQFDRSIAEDLSRRADTLSWLIKGGPGLWREEARSIGQALYDLLSSSTGLLGAARSISRQKKSLWLEFNSPADGLRIPFELMHDNEDHLVQSYIMTRQVLRSAPLISTDRSSFSVFFNDLVKRGERLRVLIIGANTDGRIPEAEREASELAEAIEDDLGLIGLDPIVKPLIGSNATYNNVNEALQDGNFHIIHYAGHGRFNDELPEISGLILLDDSGRRTMTASDLKDLTTDTALQMIFLSCCLGARTNQSVGRGSSHGVMDALVQSDTPTSVGYRWEVKDVPAKRLAMKFYEELWRSFLPGKSLLEARKLVKREFGGDDETWASPVMVVQNS